MALVRGDSISWLLTLSDENGDPLNLTDHTVTVTCKDKVTRPDTDALFQHFIIVDGSGAVTDSDGMELGPGGVTSGIIIERLEPEVTATFIPKKYIWDLEVRTGDDVHTPLNAQPETIVADVTIGT